MTKYKYTAEDHLWYLRLLRREKGMRNRAAQHYLKELRRERGITQVQLAERAGVSQQFISRLEANWRNAGPKTIERLAAALEMDRLELTLLEMLYRQTLALESPYTFEDGPVEELDVDRWTLAEAFNYFDGGLGWRYEGSDFHYGNDERAEDKLDAAMERLRERYGARDRREEDW